MATANAGINLDEREKYDALAKEIERCFEECHSILERQKNLLLEKVRRMRDINQKHQDNIKALEQIEVIRKTTNDVLTQNSIAGDKNQVVNICDDRIRNLKNERLKLDEFCELTFVPNSVEFEQCVNTFHLNECEVMEFCKRREPCVMKRLGNVDSGGIVVGFGLAVDTETDLLYVTDYVKKYICVFSKDGKFVKRFGKETLTFPYDLCLSKEYLFVSDRASLFKFSKSGKHIRSYKSSGQLMGNCTSSRSVYVCNYILDRVEVLDLNLVYKECFGSENRFTSPIGIQVYNSEIFVLTGDSSVHVFDSNHKYLQNIALPGLESKLFLRYFTIDLSGNFVISDRGAHCLKIYNARGELIESLGDGYLISPRGVATDKNNRLIVVSESYNNLQLY